MSPVVFAAGAAAFALAFIVGLRILQRRDQEQERLAAERARQLKNRRAYELNRSTIWNG
jgi:hypothetical protein